MTAILARNGAHVNVPNEAGYTALHIATQNGFENVVDALLSNNANVNIQDKNGQTALHIACRSGEFIWHINWLHELLFSYTNDHYMNPPFNWTAGFFFSI